ncbi:site-specific integrase [Rhizobiales bacterium TNE-4]|nr:site-specific integrase [Rhizobiales bacterium TNE-4]MBV1826216.1 site-specific integrase [Rhizobiales bacterium TNE-4]
MGLGKQAKILSKNQIETTLGYLSRTRYPLRNQVIFLLSVKAGLRAKEIANLKWEMLTTPDGEVSDAIRLTNWASKGKTGGRVIPLNRELRTGLSALLEDARDSSRPSPYVIATERSIRTSAQAIVNLFFKWYAQMGLEGCSSHSGRRTFITNGARKISTVGGSLRDIQMLAGHSNLTTTQRYIEGDAEAQKKIVELV